MAITVRIPPPLQGLTGGAVQLELDGDSVGAVIDALEARCPGAKRLILDDKGVRRFVNLYVGDENIRFLDGLDTRVRDGDELSIIAALAGG